MTQVTVAVVVTGGGRTVPDNTPGIFRVDGNKIQVYLDLGWEETGLDGDGTAFFFYFS